MATPDRTTSPQEEGIYNQRPRPFDARPFSSGERTELWRIGRGMLQRLRMNNALIAGEEEEKGIIDFDLASEPSEEARELIEEARTTRSSGPSNAAIVDRLSGSILEVEGLDFPKFSFGTYQRDRTGMKAALQAEFLLEKLRANRALFRAKSGEEIPTLKFINETQGVEPELIGSERLQIQFQKVKELFEALGYGEYSPENIVKYRDDQRLETPEEIKQQVEYHAERFIAAFNDFLYPGSLFKGRQKITPKYTIEMMDIDDYWIAWAKGVRNDFLLQLNTHPRHSYRWTRGKAEQTALHEIVGHLIQMQGWQNAIDRGELVPVLGVTAVHDPEQITCEGMAQTLQYLVPSINKPHESSRNNFSLSPAGWFEAEEQGLRQMVYNNVHIMINHQEVDLNQVNAYVRRFCPAESFKEIRRQVADRKKHPIKRSYLYAYGYGYLFHRWAASNLTQKGSRELLEFICSQPTTPKQEERFIMSMVQDGGRQYGEIRRTLKDYNHRPTA